MPPLGQTVWLWRRHRGLTQAALAARSGIPRPNLSAIERDRREVSVRTVRALAAALALRPGLLVDGLPPDQEVRPPLSRATMERIADAVAFTRSVRGARERQLARDLRRILANRMLALHRGTPRVRVSRLASTEAWVRLEALCGPAVVQSLVQRVVDRLR